VHATIDGNPVISGLSFGINANNRCIFIESNRPIEIRDNFRLPVDITFPEGAVFENQPVIPTLTNMSQAVSETLDSLDLFLRSI